MEGTPIFMGDPPIFMEGAPLSCGEVPPFYRPELRQGGGGELFIETTPFFHGEYFHEG